MQFKIGSAVRLSLKGALPRLHTIDGLVGEVIKIEGSCVIIEFNKDMSIYSGISQTGCSYTCGRFHICYIKSYVVKSGKVLTILTNSLVKLDDGSICKLANHNLKIGTAIKVTGTEYQTM